jgi:hypothetical protein
VVRAQDAEVFGFGVVLLLIGAFVRTERVAQRLLGERSWAIGDALLAAGVVALALDAVLY